MKEKDYMNAKEFIKEIRESYWEGYSDGYDAAIENLRKSIGSACVSAKLLKNMTMEKAGRKSEDK